MNGLTYGQGIYTYAQFGDVYEGCYKWDKKHGHGKLTFKSGKVHEGQYEDNLPHGHGKDTYPNGDSYEGPWVRGERHGTGIHFEKKTG